MSAGTMVRNVGVALPPDPGPEKKVFTDWLFSEAANVPDVVIGEPVVLNSNEGKISPTLVTVPIFVGVELAHPVPVEVSTLPTAPGEVMPVPPCATGTIQRLAELLSVPMGSQAAPSHTLSTYGVAFVFIHNWPSTGEAGALAPLFIPIKPLMSVAAARKFARIGAD